MLLKEDALNGTAYTVEWIVIDPASFTGNSSKIRSHWFEMFIRAVLQYD